MMKSKETLRTLRRVLKKERLTMAEAQEQATAEIESLESYIPEITESVAVEAAQEERVLPWTVC